MVDDYDRFMRKHHARHRQAVHGDIVIHGKDRPVQRTRQPTRPGTSTARP